MLIRCAVGGYSRGYRYTMEEHSIHTNSWAPEASTSSL